MAKKINLDSLVAGFEELPILDSMSLEEMIDYLGSIRLLKKVVSKVEGFMKEAVSARAPEGEEVYGDKYFCLLEARERTSLDTVGVKEEMGDDWYTDHCQTSEYNQLSVKLSPDEG